MSYTVLTQRGDTALMKAAMKGKNEVVAHLVNFGRANSNLQNKVRQIRVYDATFMNCI